MAAAPDNRLVCFVNVDPSFQVVMIAINELHEKRRLQHVCTVKAGNEGLRSASDSQHFGGPTDGTGYGFARTLGSVLRAFMLRSTMIEKLHDPKSDSKEYNLDEKRAADQKVPAGYYRKVQAKVKPEDQQLPLVQNKDKARAKVQAQEISANFDRLYPHFSTQNKLAEVAQGTEVNLSGMMVIVELQGGNIVKLHTINTTVRAKQDPQNRQNPNEFECPNPNVVRNTAAVLDLQDEQTDGDFPLFDGLKCLLKPIVKAEVNSMSEKDIEALLKKLRIQEGIKESNKEDGSEKSDDTSSDKPTEEEQPQKSEDK